MKGEPIRSCEKPPRVERAPTPLRRGQPMGRGRKLIARHRSRHDVAATGPRRAALWREQGGRCAMCRKPVPLEGDVWTRMHEAHAANVGMGGSRHDQGARINRRENRAGLCKPCHDRFGLMPRSERIRLAREWHRRCTVTTCKPCDEGLHEACAQAWVLAAGPEPDAESVEVACGCGHGSRRSE